MEIRSWPYDLWLGRSDGTSAASGWPTQEAVSNSGGHHAGIEQRHGDLQAGQRHGGRDVVLEDHIAEDVQKKRDLREGRKLDEERDEAPDDDIDEAAARR